MMDSTTFCTFGLVISCRYADLEPIAAAISEVGGKIVYRSTTTNHLFILSSGQIEKVLKGDLSELKEIHDRKMKEAEPPRAEGID